MSDGVASRDVELLPYDDYVASLALKRGAAGMLIRDTSDRVLLIQTTYKQHWEIPGGAVDAGESPWVTALREVAEELGIPRPLGRPLVIDHVPADGKMPEGIAYIFDGGTIEQGDVEAIRSPSPEVQSLGLYSLDEAATRVKSSLHRRISAAVYARRAGVLALCEAGTTVWTFRAGDA